MKPQYTLSTIAAAAAAFVGVALAQAPSEGPGWTGLTEPAKIIEARRGIMDEAERLMRPIDTFISTGKTANADDLNEAALTISKLLLPVAHLFPPTTNLYSPDSAEPVTEALPALWQNFSAFRAFADTAETAAVTMAATTGVEPLRGAARNLRGACDACHALTLKPYEAPAASEADKDFDFDSVLGK